ncbi:MAG: Gfo/Idh/MocA family oxidoreductase [Acidobacteriota bacterium]
MIRRTFLQSTATASLLPVAAQIPARGANDQINVACIGYGIMGQLDVQTAASIPGVKIIAVSDVYEGRLTRAKEYHGAGVFTSRDYRQILSRPDVDAVIVATPDHWHATIATEAMRAGKDVYCQKPMVRVVEEGAGIIRAQKETGRILQVGSQLASSILYAKAREIVKSGAIGKVHMIESYWDRNSAQGAWQYSIPPDATPANIDWDRFLGSAPKHEFDPVRIFRWRNYQDYGSGVAGDLFVHLFTGIHYVMESTGPNRIMSSGGLHYWKDGRDVPDLLMGFFEYPETKAHPAFNVSLRVNFLAGGGDTSGFRFIGTDGVLNVTVRGTITMTKKPRSNAPGQTASTFSKATAEEFLRGYRKKYPAADTLSPDAMQSNLEEQMWAFPSGYTEQYAHHLNFFDAVRKRRPVIEDAVFGLRAAGPALLSNVSYFEKKIVHWDPDHMTVKS